MEQTIRTHDERETAEQYGRLAPALLPWYAANARVLPWRADTQPYRVLVSEIMLQQTRVEAATAYYLRFMEALPTVEALARASEQTLFKLWEGLGYYTRARNLHKAAKLIAGEYGGVFPDTAEGLRALPGVGDYTAGAVASICFERAAAAVDGNVLRILARITEDASPIDGEKRKKEAARRLVGVYPATGRGAFTQALMELGATVCTPTSPKCGACPAVGFCFAQKNGTVSLLPVRRPKKARKAQERTVFALVCGGKLALTKRPGTGLLAGMWQLPDAEGALDAEQALAAARAMGCAPKKAAELMRHTHVFTHVEWHMLCYRIECGACAPGLVWETPENIRARYALPTAYRVFFDKLEE